MSVSRSVGFSDSETDNTQMAAGQNSISHDLSENEWTKNISTAQEENLEGINRENAAAGASSSDKRDESPRIRSTGIGVYDPLTGKACHQCRQKTKGFAPSCSNHKSNKPCPLIYCQKCLLNRYGEKSAEVATLKKWNCPKCRGVCNCSVCMKRKGQQPTGSLTQKAKSKGYSSVLDMLQSEEKDKGRGDTSGSILELEYKEIDSTSSKEMLLLEYKDNNEVDSSCSNKKKKASAEMNDSESDDEILADDHLHISLPLGIELRSVAGIDMPAEDVGNALQFLEFSAAFGEILELKEGQSIEVLQDLMEGRTAQGGNSLNLELHMHLLSILQEERGEEINGICSKLGLHYPIQNAEDYEGVEASKKLSLLNHLCDEILGTAKVRNWIYKRHNALNEHIKGARHKLTTARKEQKMLKQESNEVGMDTASPSTSNLEAVQSQAKVLELEFNVLKNNCTSNAVRTEIILLGRGGEAYWKLNCFGKSDMLRQDVGKGDTLAKDEKWFAVDEDGEEAIQKHAKRKRTRRSKLQDL